MRLNRGWKETFIAMGGGGIAYAILWVIENKAKLWTILSSLFVVGCGTIEVGVKGLHHSSAQEYFDNAETNGAGPYFNFATCDKRLNPYCTEVEFAALWDVIGDTPNPYGRSPVGNIEIRKPFMIHNKNKNEATDFFRESRPNYLLEQ